MWLILKWYTILEDFFLLDSVRYRDDVMTTLKVWLSNIKILMSDWYCKLKLTSSCVSFTIYQQFHGDIECDVTPTSLQYQNVHWFMSAIYNQHKRHGQFSGFQDLIFDLKILRFSESLMLLGKSSHIFEPRKDIVSEP